MAAERAPESSSGPTLPPLTSASYSLAVMDELRQASSARDRLGLPLSVALPPSAAPTSSTADTQLVRSALDEVLFARRAVREYGAAPISLAALRRLIHHGLRFLQDRAIRGADTAVFIRPLLAVARGENGIDQGLYELDVATNGLVRIAPFSRQAMASAVNQDSFAASPFAVFAVFAVGNLVESTKRERAVLAYLIRAAAKTSPLSTFMRTELIGEKTAGPEVLDAPWAGVSRSALAVLYTGALTRPGDREHARWSLGHLERITDELFAVRSTSSRRISARVGAANKRCDFVCQQRWLPSKP